MHTMETVKNILSRLKNYISSTENADTKIIIQFLDELVKELDLAYIYVCEGTGAKNHFMYSFVSSGEAQKIMYFNLIVMQEQDNYRLIDLFSKDGVNIFDGSMSSAKRGTAKGNLAYGYIENDLCTGFISFQPKEDQENRIWTLEEKEIITNLAYIIKPVIIERQIHDKFAYEKVLQNSSVGIFWYYPLLKLIIVPENTMEKFSIQNLVYRNAPESFISSLAKEENNPEINDIFNNITGNNKFTFISFESKNDSNTFYRLSLNANRYDDKNNPIEVMGLIENLSKEQKNYEDKAEILKKYETFRKTISRYNLAEYGVDLISGKFTMFKTDSIFSDCFIQSKNFEELINITCDKYVSEESKDSFKRTLNTFNLRENLMNKSNAISIVTNFIINGEKKRLETIAVRNSTSIYDYTKDVMIFVRDITLNEIMNYDSLTGTLTMSHFLNKIRDMKFDANNKDEKYYMVYFNFANFKIYNLQCGVVQGDNALKKFSELLKKTFSNGLVSRFSDDHFAVFISYNNKEKLLDDLKIVADKCKTLDDKINLDIKMGFIEFNPGDDLSTCVDCARLSSEEIKKEYGIHFHEYDEKLKIKVEKEKYIADHIDDAIEKGWIKIYYQPVIDVKSVTLVAFEALARWVDPTYGFLSPIEIIPVLERNNLIYKLDSFIIKSIGKLIRSELDKGNKAVPISFNLSRADFLTCQPFEEAEKCVREYHIDRKYLCVEITETIAIYSPEVINRATKQFRNAGYEVWMDDFGSGYSSLNALKNFSLDEIKIDMGFLRSFDEKSKIIVSNIVNMAKKLKIRTLTEGVETKEHFDFLKDIGCERVQGYYFSKPLPYEEVMNILKEKNINIK